MKNPSLISEGAEVFGSQCIVVGIDAKRNGKGGYTVYVNGGRIDMQLDLIEWVREIQARGAGEICLNSIDTDGVRGGFDMEMLQASIALDLLAIADGGIHAILENLIKLGLGDVARRIIQKGDSLSTLRKESEDLK